MAQKKYEEGGGSRINQDLPTEVLFEVAALPIERTAKRHGTKLETIVTESKLCKTPECVRV
jgi:hypothetical protein